MIIDLHCHTTCSDGTLTPKELIQLAKAKKISVISITDHDTVDGLEEGKKEADKLGITFLNGIELAGSFKNEEEIHILGYDFEINEELLNTLSFMVKERVKRNQKMIKLFQENEINITLEDLEAISGKKIISRAHFAEVLTSKGYTKSREEAFKKYLNPGCPTYIPRQYFTPKQCIDIIHKANGKAVLAHPTLYNLGFEEIKNLIIDLKEKGLDGVEVKHSTYSYEQEAFLTNFVKKQSLILTGGSDFHGSIKKGLSLGSGYGTLVVPYRFYESLIRKK